MIAVTHDNYQYLNKKKTSLLRSSIRTLVLSND